MTLARVLLVALAVAVFGCSPPATEPDGGGELVEDAGPGGGGLDAGVDAGTGADAGAGVDAGVDGGVDAGIDAGVDAGFDAGVDAGVDAGFDAGLPPGGLTYLEPTTSYRVGVAITPNTPFIDAGSLPLSYTWSPAMPAGLSISTATGIISGTPTEAMPRTAYHVTAQTSRGTSSTDLSLAVYDVPRGLSYTTNPAIYRLGTSITNTARFDGGCLPVTFDGGVLPRGLKLDPATGVISGIPNQETDAGTYVITLTNDAGSTSVDLSLAVYQPPYSLSYPGNPVVYVTGRPIEPNVPTFFGGGPKRFSDDAGAPLPAGLLLDVSTGVISGTPTVASPTNDFNFYTITAANPVGSTFVQVNLIVMASVSLAFTPAIAGAEAGVTNVGPVPFNITGGVALVNDGSAFPTQGCSMTVGSVVGMVALADQNATCNWRAQALAAQQGGALAVIVIDDVVASVPPNRYDQSVTGPTIPAISVTRAVGQQLKAALQSGPVTVTMSR